MKKILKLSLISICLLNIVSCGSDGLNKYRRNGQLVDLDYLTLNEKLVQDESFVFYLTSEGCPGCKAFYPEVEEFLKKYNANNEDNILDLGCGEGRDAIYLLEKGYQVLAIDYSINAINHSTNNDKWKN